MDPRLAFDEQERAGVYDGLADIPLVTLAWRALREQAREESRARGRLAELLQAVAMEAFRLRQSARSAPQEEARGWTGAAERLEDALARFGVRIVAPQGEPYTEELMDYLENLEQRPAPDIEGPKVAEVVSPAVLWRGGLLCMGKAIIEVPARQDEPVPDGNE